MTLDQTIAISSSIGACLSALAALLIILQNSKQRQASYQPALVIRRERFSASASAGATSIPDDWISLESNSDKIPGLFFNLTMLNIGLGSAKNLILEWDFDIDSAIKSANELAKTALIPAYISAVDDEISINSRQINSKISLWKNQKSQSLDYILPSSTNENGQLITLPPAYMLIASSIVFFYQLNKSLDGIPSFPRINLRVKYHDIGNKKHEKKIHLQPKITMLINSDKGDAEFHAILESIEN